MFTKMLPFQFECNTWISFENPYDALKESLNQITLKTNLNWSPVLKLTKTLRIQQDWNGAREKEREIKTGERVRIKVDFNTLPFIATCSHKPTHTQTQISASYVLHAGWASKMGKSYTKHYLHISYKRIITYMCYTTLIIGWHAFNCISLFGVMSMESLNENNDSTTAAEVVNLSQASMKSNGIQQENLSSVTPLPSKRSMEIAKLDFATPNAVYNAPIQGWECYCWNTTTGYEVSNRNPIWMTCWSNDRQKKRWTWGQNDKNSWMLIPSWIN